MGGLLGSLFGGGSKKAPKTPDYTGAAQATAQGNLEAARAAAAANRVNQYTPYGSLVYSHSGTDPDNGWNATVNLSPTGQQLLDYQNQTSLGLGGLTTDALGRVGSSLSSPFDYSSVGDVQDAAYGAFTSRLDPQWSQNEKMLDAKLANQGIMPGSEAYEDAQRSFGQARNDAYQQATLGAIQTSPQTMQLATALRNQPLNELNAIRTGSQVTNPAFQSVPQQATTSGPNLLGAAQATYNSNLNSYNAATGNQNSMMGGLFGLGGSLFGAAGSAGGFGNLFG